MPNPYFPRKELGRCSEGRGEASEAGRACGAGFGRQGRADPTQGDVEFVHHRVPRIIRGLKNRGIVERKGGWV
jgi:hypothetical protein